MCRNAVVVPIRGSAFVYALLYLLATAEAAASHRLLLIDLINNGVLNFREHRSIELWVRCHRQDIARPRAARTDQTH
jgi:hypothetical protein